MAHANHDQEVRTLGPLTGVALKYQVKVISIYLYGAWSTRLMEEREVIVYCDLHGHSRKHNVFIYGCENRGNPQRRLRERIFPVILSRNAPGKVGMQEVSRPGHVTLSWSSASCAHEQ